MFLLEYCELNKKGAWILLDLTRYALGNNLFSNFKEFIELYVFR
ncbi:hypothetical protein ES708_25549 [subsurface metagenome]